VGSKKFMQTFGGDVLENRSLKGWSADHRITLINLGERGCKGVR